MPPVGFEPTIPVIERAADPCLRLRGHSSLNYVLIILRSAYGQRNKGLCWSYDPGQSGNIFLQNLGTHITGYTLSYTGTSIFTAMKVPYSYVTWYLVYWNKRIRSYNSIRNLLRFTDTAISASFIVILNECKWLNITECYVTTEL